MAINQEKKSNRLLGNRRFTSADLNTSQEAFSNVNDLNAGEIYTQQDLIPSSGLPYSGSSQDGETSGVLKYYFRQRLTKSNVANDVFFFMVPTGSNSGVTPQLIQDGQQNNFISPKYSVSSLANANTEDSTPGYGVKVFKSTSLNSGSLVLKLSEENLPSVRTITQSVFSLSGFAEVALKSIDISFLIC